MNTDKETYKKLKREFRKIVDSYEYFITEILGVGERNPMGKEIKEYELKVPYSQFMEYKTDILRDIERFRMTLMKEVPTSYTIYSTILPKIASEIIAIDEKGNIATPLRIKMDLELLFEKLNTAIEMGDVDKLLSETYDFDKMSIKIYKDSLKKVAEKGEKAMIVMDALLKYSSRQKPMSVFDIAGKLNRNARWVKSALKDIREEAPEILRIKMVENEYRYYIPDTYKRFYVE